MAKVNVRPIGEKVLVKRVEASDVTSGGIVLPESAREKPRRGIVQAVGDGKLLKDGTRRPLELKNNDEILFTSYAGTDLKINGDEYLIMDESDVMAVIG